jgi:hypothetical protein
MKKKQNLLRHPVVLGANIVLFHILLVGIAFEAGLRLFQYGFRIDKFGVAMIGSIVLGSVWVYLKFWYGHGVRKPSFLRPLSTYLLMSLAGWMLCVIFFNYGIGGIMEEKEAGAAYRAVPVAIYSQVQGQEAEVEENGKPVRKRLGEWRQSLREKLTARIAQQQPGDKSKKSFLVLLLSSVLSLFLVVIAYNAGSGMAIFILGSLAIMMLSGFLLYRTLPAEKKKRAFWLAPLYYLGGFALWFLLLSIFAG